MVFARGREDAAMMNADDGPAALAGQRQVPEENGGSPAAPLTGEGKDPALAPPRFLDKDEPGGVDDADTWLVTTVAMIPVAAIVATIAHYVLTGQAYSVLIGLGVAGVMFL